MRTARLSRARRRHSLVLTATFLAQRTGGTTVAHAEEPVAPAFLSWKADPSVDGHNHFPSFIIPNTPAGNPGSVDVIVIDRDTGETTVLSQGFTYVVDDEAPPETTTTTTIPRARIPPMSSSTTLATTTAAPTTVPTSTTAPISARLRSR